MPPASSVISLSVSLGSHYAPRRAASCQARHRDKCRVSVMSRPPGTAAGHFRACVTPLYQGGDPGSAGCLFHGGNESRPRPGTEREPGPGWVLGVADGDGVRGGAGDLDAVAVGAAVAAGPPCGAG